MSKSIFSFGKDKRLLVAKQFADVFNHPTKKIHSEHLLVFLKTNDQPSPRLGLAITKKKLKNASDRNYLKRIIREQFRQNQFKIANLDMVFIIKIGFNKKTKINLNAELEDLFNKMIAFCALDDK